MSERQRVKDALMTYTKTELKQFIHDANITGYGKLKKNELIEVMTFAAHFQRFLHIEPKGKKAVELPTPAKQKILAKHIEEIIEGDANPMSVNVLRALNKKMRRKQGTAENDPKIVNFVKMKLDEATTFSRQKVQSLSDECKDEGDLLDPDNFKQARKKKKTEAEVSDLNACRDSQKAVSDKCEGDPECLKKLNAPSSARKSKATKRVEVVPEPVRLLPSSSKRRKPREPSPERPALEFSRSWYQSYNPDVVQKYSVPFDPNVEPRTEAEKKERRKQSIATEQYLDAQRRRERQRKIDEGIKHDERVAREQLQEEMDKEREKRERALKRKFDNMRRKAAKEELERQEKLKKQAEAEQKRKTATQKRTETVQKKTETVRKKPSTKKTETDEEMRKRVFREQRQEDLRAYKAVQKEDKAKEMYMKKKASKKQ